MKNLKYWLAVVALSLIANGTLAAPSDNPEQIVRGISHDVLEIIRKNDKDPSKTREQVDNRVAPLANYSHMTALAVGRPWRTATPEQQQALTREFRQMLVRTYLSALTIYKNAQVDVKGPRTGATNEEQDIRSEVQLPGQKPIPLDFSFEKTDAGWKVYDISVDGISFINNHRNQFNAIIQKDGIDGLIKNLSDRNAASHASSVANSK